MARSRTQKAEPEQTPDDTTPDDRAPDDTTLDDRAPDATASEETAQAPTAEQAEAEQEEAEQEEAEQEEAGHPEPEAVADGEQAPTPGIPEDIAAMGYEEARDELVRIVAQLESGQRGLEESMGLWERGEALAAHCTRWLDTAQQRITRTTAQR